MMHVFKWVRGIGPNGKDIVEMYYCGRCDRAYEGRVGFDVKGRPVFLGEGEYTVTVGGHDCEDLPIRE